MHHAHHAHHAHQTCHASHAGSHLRSALVACGGFGARDACLPSPVICRHRFPPATTAFVCVLGDHKGLLVLPSLSPFPRPSPALPLLAPVLPFHCLPLSLLTLPHTLSRPFFLTVECVLLLWTTEFVLLLKRYGCRQTTKTR